MAKNTEQEKPDVKPQEALLPIEHLAEIHDVPSWVMVGLQARYGWGAGKEMTEKEFLKAKDNWLTGSINKEVK